MAPNGNPKTGRAKGPPAYWRGLRPLLAEMVSGPPAFSALKLGFQLGLGVASGPWEALGGSWDLQALQTRPLRRPEEFGNQSARNLAARGRGALNNDLQREGLRFGDKLLLRKVVWGRPSRIRILTLS